MFEKKPPSLSWFFIGYWILKTKPGFYPVSYFIEAASGFTPRQQRIRKDADWHLATWRELFAVFA